MQPNFEDLKRRIAALEKESSAPSEAPRLEEIRKKETRVHGAKHPDSEELCGYADGVLRRDHPGIWQDVNSHLKECLECQSEVKQLRSVIPLSLQVKNGFKELAEEIGKIPIPPIPWKWIAGVVAILVMIAIPSTLTGYRLGSAQPKAEAQILREENEKLRAELAEERAKKEEFKEANRKLLELIERLRAIVPKEKIAYPPSSVPVPYTDPRVLPVFPEVPYTDPRVQPAFPEVPYTPPPKPRK